ncbi:MAG: hypothetical protein K0S80_3850 [Neobacillus sp.]|nr:hypothetical protein [Neobacillus sp.]
MRYPYRQKTNNASKEARIIDNQNVIDIADDIKDVVSSALKAQTNASTAQSTADSALGKANTADEKANNIQSQVNALIIGANTSPAETLQARVSEDGTTFSTLKAHLDDKGKKIKDLTSQVDYFTTPERNGFIYGGGTVESNTQAIINALKSGKEVQFKGITYTVKIPDANQFYALEANGSCPRIKGVKGQTVIKLQLDNTVDPTTNTKSGILVAWNTEVSGIIFDGGFDPTQTQADLASIVNMGSNSRIYDCEFKNSKGSNLVIGASNVYAYRNKFDKFGDHAVYIIKEHTSTRISNIYIYDNTITEDDTYQNSSANGKIRGVIKIRDNVENVFVYNNTVTGDQCVLVSGKAVSANGIPSKINIYNNTLYSTYSGIHLDTDLTTDNGFRITDEEVYARDNRVYVTADNTTGIALANSRIKAVNNDIISTSSANAGTTGITNFSTGDTGRSILRRNRFKGMRIGIFSAGTGSIITENEFYDIKASGGCAVYSYYGDKVVRNDFFNCQEGLRITGTTSPQTRPKKSVFDNNSFYECDKGILHKNTASNFSLTNTKFYDCVIASL